MNPTQARQLIEDTFTQPFSKDRFAHFIHNLLNHIDETKAHFWSQQYVKDAFKPGVDLYERIATYTDPTGEKIDALIVRLKRESGIERARTFQRNFVADYLVTRGKKEAALVAFVSPDSDDWRFSLVKMEYTTRQTETGKVKVEEKLTPARRYSFLVGTNEASHTAQAQLVDILSDDRHDPALPQIEEAFSVEKVTKEFFERYKTLVFDVQEQLDRLAEKDAAIAREFKTRSISALDFSKKLMGQIVFLYFLQRKGWLGVNKDKDWGAGQKDFLRRLFKGEFGRYENFFNDVLEPLFYDTLATDRGHEAWCSHFKCRMPFLNGGLFEPLNDYDWKKTDIRIPDRLFSNSEETKQGDIGTGILDVFDRYNFTVNEAEPLEKEVAIDPEMLGKVFENLLGVKERKAKGSYYTPREIVHYMCQESLVNYLDAAINHRKKPLTASKPKQGRLFRESEPEQTSLQADSYEEIVPREDIATFIRLGDQAADYEAARKAGTTSYHPELPKGIEKHAKLLDEKLREITVCDPAIGSGAFPVGMMTEIVRARCTLTPYFNDVTDRTPYHFKRHAIQNCLYGVDIDPAAVEIAKLRLWLSLVVDEDDVKQIKPLPNLDYKIVTGNSLLGVEMTLFNEKLFRRLEELKPRYFDETHKDKKNAYKRQIDQIIHELTKGKKNFDFEIYFSEVFHTKRGFDVVIANPPYGFRNVLSKTDKIYFRKHRGIQFPSGDIAELFVTISLDKLTRQSGSLTFIIPKKSLYGESWLNVRRLWLKNSLRFLMDASKAFEKVLLEQVAFGLLKSDQKPLRIGVGRLNADTDAIEVFRAFRIAEIFSEDLRNAQVYKGMYPSSLVQKIKSNSIENTASLVRGEIGISNITPHLTFEAEGNHPCVKGIDIVRYGLKPDVHYLKRSIAKQYINDYEHEKVLAQEIVAHIQNPQPHILFTMFYDDQGRLFNDTCVEIKLLDKRIHPNFVMGYFHSAFANWYAYNFVYNRAIRTMHFINYYITQIPFPRAVMEDSCAQKPIITLVDRILAAKKLDPKTDTTALEREIDSLVYDLYGLTKEEIAIVDPTFAEASASAGATGDKSARQGGLA